MPLERLASASPFRSSPPASASGPKPATGRLSAINAVEDHAIAILDARARRRATRRPWSPPPLPVDVRPVPRLVGAATPPQRRRGLVVDVVPRRPFPRRSGNSPESRGARR
jgi:hypothetical protein